MTSQIKKIWLLATLVIIALFLRLSDINEASYFNYDEARDAVAERAILAGKLTLLGPETTLGNVTTYFGPAHYYLMAPALFLSRLDPIGPYIFTALLGVLTSLVIWIWTRSFLSALFYAVFPIAVFFNRVSWNPNTIPFFIASGFLLLKEKRTFLSGFFFGIALQLHWTAGLMIFIAAAVYLRDIFTKKFLMFILGLVLGLTPVILFDIRHDFLYLRSLAALIIGANAGHGFPMHYFLGFLPLLAALIKFLPKPLVKIIIPLCFVISILVIFSLKKNHQYTINSIKSISAVISRDQKNNSLPFNVVSENSSDARGYSYRYFLTNSNLTPLGPGEYSVSDHIYVVTNKDINEILKSPLYEITSFNPKNVSKVWTVSGSNLYRLEK